MSHPRLDAWWEFVWQGCQLAWFLGNSTPTKANEDCGHEVPCACGLHRCNRSPVQWFRLADGSHFIIPVTSDRQLPPSRLRRRCECPLWVIRGHSSVHQPMSALPPKADMFSFRINVC